MVSGIAQGSKKIESYPSGSLRLFINGNAAGDHTNGGKRGGTKVC
jgi:hypothetical protein